jgi:PD-(D/E)XK endonuclease
MATKDELSTNQKGAIAEMAIAWDAFKAGVDVFRPVVEGGRCDFVFDTGLALLKVQCKWGVRQGEVVSVRLTSSCRKAGGKYLRRVYNPDEIDLVAAYCAELDQCYYLPISLVAGRRQIYLRLAPAKNNQRAGLKWAKHYRDLGAIAQLGER